MDADMMWMKVKNEKHEKGTGMKVRVKKKRSGEKG